MDPVSFWATPLGWTLITLGQVLLITVGVLIAVAFLLLADRKVWAGVQMRKGPNVVGPFGLLQSFADMIKFVLKEVVIPAGADKAVFIIAPIITVILAFMAWAVIPFAPRLGRVGPERRHSVYLRGVVAGRLRHHHGRLGFELEVSLPGFAAFGGADGVL